MMILNSLILLPNGMLKSLKLIEDRDTMIVLYIRISGMILPNSSVKKDTEAELRFI